MLNENLLPALITLGNVTRSIMPVRANVLKCHKLCCCCITLIVSLALSPDTCPNNASYYGNRAATLMMLGRFREALEDAQQSVRLDDSFVRVRGELQAPHSVPCLHLLQLLELPFYLCSQGHLREGKCHLSLGNAMAASRCFQRVLELDHKNTQAQQEVRGSSDVTIPRRC